MLDKLKNMEPLSPQEENRIMRKLRAVVLVMAGLVLAFAIWSIVKKRDFTAVYYVIVSVFLFCNWFLIDVAPAFLCRALAGRSDKKVSAFLKMAGLGLLGNIGLDLDHGQFPVDTLFRLQLVDVTDIDQLGHLFLDLFQDIIISGSHDRDPGDPGIRRNARADAFNIITSSGEQAGHTAQNTGGVVYQKLKYFLLLHFHSPLFLCSVRPAGTP